jgi:hypothetical protein
VRAPGKRPMCSAGEWPVAQRRLGRLVSSTDMHASAWVLVALRDFDHTVGSIVPPVFEAYARVFHPATRGWGDDEVTVRWADGARANGREMHAAAEWGSLVGSWRLGYRDYPAELYDSEPATGELPEIVAKRLGAVLSGHTDQPGSGFFGIWNGWGRGTVTFSFPKGTPAEVKQREREASDAALAAWHELIDSAATFAIPHRKMHLLRGPLVAIEDFYEGSAGPASLCLRDPPSLWWPADQAWCVGTDIDLMTTYVGGSSSAIDALLADDELEVLRVRDSQSITWDADTINPLPEPP